MIQKKPADLCAKDILRIQEIILKGIDSENAGCYRTISVRIAGSTVVMPNPRKVPALMEAFQGWLNSKQEIHPVAFAGEAHYRLLSIHPFVDGNGRSARLLMNLLLMSEGYPPAIIRKRDRLAYISAFEKAQLGGPQEDYLQLMAKAVDRSLDIYLNAARGDSPQDDLDEDAFLKIGELAKAVGRSVSTIRYWTHEGLLTVAQNTPSGYQLYTYDMVQRCDQIKALQEQRFTLEEIKARLV